MPKAEAARHAAERIAARRLDKLGATRDALVDSRINSEHARILDSAAESGPTDEAKTLAAAETQTPEQLRKTVRDHQNELTADNGAKRLERQRKKRTASYNLVDDKLGNPRLADGTPLPAAEFHRLACDADILTGLFREADRNDGLS